MLENLPHEILLHIFQLLGVQDLLTLRGTNQTLHNIIHTLENGLLTSFIDNFRLKQPNIDLPPDIGLPLKGLVCIYNIQKQWHAAEEVGNILADRIVSTMDPANASEKPVDEEKWLREKRNILRPIFQRSLFLLEQFFRLFRDVVNTGESSFAPFSDFDYLELKDVYDIDQQRLIERFRRASTETLVDATHTFWILGMVLHAVGLEGEGSIFQDSHISASKVLVQLGMNGIRYLLQHSQDGTLVEAAHLQVEEMKATEPIGFERSQEGSIYRLLWSTSAYGPSGRSRKWRLQAYFLDNQNLWSRAATAITQTEFEDDPSISVAVWLVTTLKEGGQTALLTLRFADPDSRP